MNILSIAGNYVLAKNMWDGIKNGRSVISGKPLSQEESAKQLKERLPQILSGFSWGVIGFFGNDEITLRKELGPAIILLGTHDRDSLLTEACSYLKEVMEYSKKVNIDLNRILENDPAIQTNFRIASLLCKLHSKTLQKDEISLLCSLVIPRATQGIFRQVLLTLKGCLEAHGYEVPKELVEALNKLPRPKEVDYWEEYQKTLKEFEEKGKKFHERAKEEWEKIKRGEAEDLIGSLQEVIWNLSEGVVYNFAVRKFKLVKEAYEIFLKAHEFAKENDLFKTRLSEEIWLGKLKRVNLKWGNDIKWPEDYRVISNRIIRLTRIAEFMMWKRRIPEFLYANPYINLGADYEHNDPPLWALTRGLMMILNHNRSKGVPPSMELQEEVLNHALRLNLLWPEKTEVWECRDGKCVIFRGDLNEKAIKELQRNAWDGDIVFYHGKGIVIGYSRKRKLGYACGKSLTGGLIRKLVK